MLRSCLSLVLTMALLATATAQTAPTTNKTATKTKATVRKPAAKTKVATQKPTSSAASATNPKAETGADGKGQGVYAAPGMAVDVTSGKEVQGYRGDAPASNTVKKSGNTLTPSSSK